MNWNECAIKFHVGDHPGFYRIFIEGVFQKAHPSQGNDIKWAVRSSDGISALCKPHEDLKNYDFLVEKDFRGEEKAHIRFDTKEEALEAYLQWKTQDNDEDNM
jgi:hypothetical protein